MRKTASTGSHQPDHYTGAEVLPAIVGAVISHRLYHMPNEARENNLGRSTDMPCDHNCWLFCLSQWPGLNEPMIWQVAFLANPSKAGISVEARSDTRLIALLSHSWFCYSITRCWALDCGPYPNHPGLESRGAKCSCVLSMRTYIYI